MSGLQPKRDLEVDRHNGIDALLPQEMAEKAEQIGVAKTRLDFGNLLALAVLAGAFIAFGSAFSLVVTAGAEGAMPYGVTRLLAGLAFSLGLILVIVGGAELFTGNNLMIMACASGRVSPRELLRAWAVVYVGNFLGALGIALLVFVAAGYTHGNGAVGAVTLASAEAKVSFSAFQAFVHGVMANILVCLATWLCFSARTTSDKIMAIVLPIAAFVAAGFEHSIANMYSLPLALLVKLWGPVEFWQAIGRTPAAYPHLAIASILANLLWVTLGNMAGGIGVGITYWFVYLRRRAAAARRPA
jgi:formate transporter